MDKKEYYFQRCMNNISKNLKHPFYISNVMRDRIYPKMYSVFIDVLSTTTMVFDDYEIKSAKDYRQLRNLVKTRLIHAIHDLYELAGESLRELGALKYCSQPPNEPRQNHQGHPPDHSAQDA